MQNPIVRWAPRIIAAAILTIGALPKFTGGSAMLAERLPGGALSVAGIGILELIAIVLLLIPRTAVFGGLLAGGLMLGAIGSHMVGPVGLDGDFLGMFFMAIVAALAAGAVVLLERGRLVFTGFAQTVPRDAR